MTKAKIVCTHSEAYHLICSLPKYLQQKMPTPTDLLFISANTFSKFMQRVMRLGSCHKDVLFHSVNACETLIAEKELRGEAYDMQRLVRNVVNPRLNNSPSEEKREMRSLVYSLFGMRSKIKQGWKDARVVIIK